MTIYERLAQLEDENPEPIFKASFLNFLYLLNECIMSEMIISLTPDNEIYATLQGVKKHCLIFKADGIIKYFVK